MKKIMWFGFCVVCIGGISSFGFSKDVIPEAKISASQVSLTNSNTALESTNVQGALQELSLDLGQVIIGSWTITNRNQESLHEATGEVVINSDGTFNLKSGSFAAIGMGSSGECRHLDEGQEYESLAYGALMFSYRDPLVSSGESSAIPMVVSLSQDKVVFVGSGGCGTAGLQRISTLTRKL